MGYHFRFIVMVCSFFVFFLPSFLTAGVCDEKAVTVVVVKKDNLVNICKDWLENPNNWPAVARFNRLSNPNLIIPGEQIKIPAKLLKGITMEGKVSFVKGDVRLYSSEDGAPRALEQDDIVSQGTKIETGKNSAVEIFFEDGSSIFLRSDTRIDIRTSRQRQPYYMIRQLFVPAGKIIMRIKKSTGQDSRFEIHTPSAVSAARGTWFRVSVDEDITTRTEVLNGVVGVKGQGKGVVVDPGEGTWVKKGGAANMPSPLPGPPTLEGLEPVYQMLPVHFSVVPPDTAVASRVIVAKDPEMKDVVKEVVVKSGHAIPAIILPDAIYYCQVMAINRDGLEGIPSQAAAFEVRVNPLPPFVQKPLAGRRFKTDTVTFEWLRVADAAFYQLQVAKDPQFSVLFKEVTGLTNAHKILELAEYGPYYFRVRSIAADGFEGLWSDVSEFIHVAPPKVPEPEVPVVDEKRITLRWQDMGPGMAYDFQMARDSEFKEILLETKIENSAVTFDRPEDGGIYYVRVRAVDPDGYDGDFTPVQTFEIKKFSLFEAGAIVTWIVGALIIIF